MREASSTATAGVTDPAEERVIADSLETFIETVTEALATTGVSEAALEAVADAGETLTTELTEFITDHTRLRERVETLEAETDALDAETERLQTELETERETRAKEAAEDRKRLHELETTVEDSSEESPSASTPETPSQPAVEPPQTPLEDVIRVPEHLVEESLTANQQRARFVAKDIHEYTQRVPAGRAIKSSELRRVLTAGEDATMYTETVSRVMDFLDDLGGEAVQVRDGNHGERIVVFTDAIVDRIHAQQRHAESNSVVTDQEVAR